MKKNYLESVLGLMTLILAVSFLLKFIDINTENNEIYIDKRLIDLRAVRANVERLKAENPEGSVIIQADKNSKTGLLVETMDQVRLAGVQNVSIAAEKD